jgi:hypothetical protein
VRAISDSRRATAVSKWCAYSSMPMARLPCLTAAINVVPEPQQKSKQTPLGGVLAFTSVSMSHRGFCVGWTG